MSEREQKGGRPQVNEQVSFRPNDLHVGDEALGVEEFGSDAYRRTSRCTEQLRQKTDQHIVPVSHCRTPQLAAAEAVSWVITQLRFFTRAIHRQIVIWRQAETKSACQAELRIGE